MKRFLSFFLSLILMLGCLVIPADVLAAGIGSTSYSQQITVGYSWSTGKTTGNSMSCRVFFKNYDAAPITSYRVDMRFMDKAGNLLETVKGEQVTKTIATNKGTWSPFLTAPNGTASFTWRLVYHVNDNTQALNTGWMTVKASSDTDLAAAFVLLNTARKEASNTSRSQFIRSTSYQEQFLFNINSRTGLVKEKTRSFRAYLKNVGDGTILRYNLSLKCMDSDDEVIQTAGTGPQRVTLEPAKGIWSAWVQIPMDVASKSMFITFDCLE